MQNVLYISYIESIHPIRTIRRSSALPHMGMRYIIASIRILSSGSSSSSVKLGMAISFDLNIFGKKIFCSFVL